jgi:hypothetical protein
MGNAPVLYFQYKILFYKNNKVNLFLFFSFLKFFFVNVENLKLVHPIAEKVVGRLSSIFHHFGLQKKY